MSISRLKKELAKEIEILTNQLLTGNVDDFAEYRFVVGQAYAYRNTLDIIKDLADEASRGSNVSPKD